MAPEFDPRPFAAQALVPNAVHRRDPAAVRDRVTALDRLPRVELLRAVLVFFRRMPADGGGIEENVRALERRQPRAFRIPLIPAHERSDRTDLRVERAESEIARREIELFVV